jgi:hypothetical protein
MNKLSDKFFESEGYFEKSEQEEEILVKPKKQEKIKGIGLFDHLKAIYQEPYDPKYFDNLSDSDKKTFSTYMINRYLSMNPQWLFVVNYVQQYSFGMSNEMLYKVYANLIPKGRTFLKWVKGKKEKKYNKDLIELISLYYEVSQLEATNYITILLSNTEWRKRLIEICRMYGNTDDEIKMLLR